MKKGKIIIIQGAQYGSEGKGQIAALIAERESVDVAVRTGSINAGHTVWFNHRDKGWTSYSMQQIPTAWVIPGVKLVIGAGAFIHEGILEREIAMISEATGEDVRKRLFIDHRCTLHSEHAEQAAKVADRHHKMGATGKGSSEALKQKLDSRGDFDLARSLNYSKNRKIQKLQFTDTSVFLNDAYDHGSKILLEGTQGSLLDLNLAEHPFVTNRGCNAATWLAEAGLSPGLNVETILVARTFPIRVAGNSGGMGHEISWESLWKEWNRKLGKELIPSDAIAEYEALKDSYFQIKLSDLGADLLEFWDSSTRSYHFAPELWNADQKERFSSMLADIPSLALNELSKGSFDSISPYLERTTVTRKPRRIAEFNHEEFSHAIMWNRPTKVFLGFANYIDPSLWNETKVSIVGDSRPLIDMIEDIERIHGVPVCGTSTGAKPENHHFW